MKIVRIGCMVLATALLIFAIAPYASAQPAISGLWYKGSVSAKGYDYSQGGSVSSSSGKGTMYVNIVTAIGGYDVITCIEDMVTDDVYHRSTSFIPEDDIRGVIADGSTMIWDFNNSSAMVFDVGAAGGNYVTYPIFTVKIKGSSVSFKSFACLSYDRTSIPDEIGFGSCKVSFKSIDPLKVPTGPNRCIIP